MSNKTKAKSISLDQMLLFVFDSFDSMTFIRTEANKDEVPYVFKQKS
ncbi:MAG: hypothetical protein ACI97N_001420 [Cognaticolwellia sp.]|jgi:hypothetical protein